MKLCQLYIFLVLDASKSTSTATCSEMRAQIKSRSSTTACKQHRVISIQLQTHKQLAIAIDVTVSSCWLLLRPLSRMLPPCRPCLDRRPPPSLSEPTHCRQPAPSAPSESSDSSGPAPINRDDGATLQRPCPSQLECTRRRPLRRR